MAGYYSGIGVNGRRDPFWRGAYDYQMQRLNDWKTQHSGPYMLVAPYDDPTVAAIRATDGSVFRL